MGNKCFDFKKGMDEYSEGTSDCGPDYAGCIYQYNGRCCYHVATIQINSCKACYEPYSGFDYD